MRKIGIMTWYTYRNYGTALQAVALSYVIEQLGYEVRVIRYIPKECTIKDVPNYHDISKKVGSKLKNFLNSHYNSQQKENLFKKFLCGNLKETERYETYSELHELNTCFDAFVCGSDQIWTPECFDEKYFLSFVENSDKMVAYAPSMGVTNIKNSYIAERMRFLIGRYSHLSVREAQAAEQIMQMCGKQAQIVLDPTLLLRPQIWDELCSHAQLPMQQPTEYVLCYFLGDYTRYKRAVKHISQVLSLPVYVIPVFQNQVGKKNSVPFDIGPEEFVALIKNAKYVCTDSFHGMAFAVNYKVPFTVFKRFKEDDPNSQNIRITNLLESLHLEARLMNPKDSFDKKQLLSCDFTTADRLLCLQRKHSVEYLRSALAEACNATDSQCKLPFTITDLCCGCGACASICPKQAISIIQDDQGLQHYKINYEQCVGCKLCQKVCPFVSVKAANLKENTRLYAFQSPDNLTLRRSSSGGAAYEIARLLNKQGYWVSGVTYDEQRDVAKHILVKPYETEKLKMIQGSKYLQSESASAIKAISQLKSDEKVVFFGTPCQTAGLNKLLTLQKRRENAILVDLICHGVPTRLLWKKYLSQIQLKYGLKEHSCVMFRAEDAKWHNREIEITDDKNSYRASEKKDYFYQCFKYGLCYMKTCYECPYREKSAADIRLGDFWGPIYRKDEKGVSMVISINERGQKLIYALQDLLEKPIKEYSSQKYWEIQFPNNPAYPIYYSNLLEELKEKEPSLNVICSKYCRPEKRIETLQNMKSNLKSWFRRE